MGENKIVTLFNNCCRYLVTSTTDSKNMRKHINQAKNLSVSSQLH